MPPPRNKGGSLTFITNKINGVPDGCSKFDQRRPTTSPTTAPSVQGSLEATDHPRADFFGIYRVYQLSALVCPTRKPVPDPQPPTGHTQRIPSLLTASVEPQPAADSSPSMSETL
ncbi:hypothetical protein DFP72DRAFT_847476 [Ephemerocybe angulata]|uniref:Uncharacterized protein n=1 Tax=Ephemerocybe angulata TaxID=980116 RepID=A0A8H6M712_9AGAR|nr:hypothetical protein DFP72DRAFT_847476 [Tulosesus angulatus]